MILWACEGPIPAPRLAVVTLQRIFLTAEAFSGLLKSFRSLTVALAGEDPVEGSQASVPQPDVCLEDWVES